MARRARARMGRPPVRYPRNQQVAVRFTEAELRGLARALRAEHPGAAKPTMAAWLRELAIEYASDVLDADVRRDRVARQR